MNFWKRFKDGIHISTQSLQLLWKNKKLFFYRAIPMTLLLTIKYPILLMLGLKYNFNTNTIPFWNLTLFFLASYALYMLAYHCIVITQKENLTFRKSLPIVLTIGLIFTILGMFIHLMFITTQGIFKYNEIIFINNFLYYLALIALSFIIPATVLTKQSVYKIISNALKTIKKSVPELLGLATIMGIMTKLLNLFCITSPHILNSIPLPITGYKSILVVLIFSVPKLLFWIVPKTFWIVGITTLYQKKNKTTQ